MVERREKGGMDAEKGEEEEEELKIAERWIRYGAEERESMKGSTYEWGSRNGGYM
jgi:hypothetical protein